MESLFPSVASLEGRVVLVMRLADKVDLAINDLAISAKMSAHGNMLRPIGCCLETTPPIIAYEFAVNGILADQICLPPTSANGVGEKVTDCKADCSCYFLSPYCLPKTCHPHGYTYDKYLIR